MLQSDCRSAGSSLLIHTLWNSAGVTSPVSRVRIWQIRCVCASRFSSCVGTSVWSFRICFEYERGANVRVCVCVSWGAAVCGGWHDLPGQIWCPCLWPDAVEVELIGGRERERELHEAYTAVNRTELRWTWTDEGWQSEELWVLNSYVCAGTEVLDYSKSLSSGKCRASKIFVAPFIKMFWNNRIKMACSNFDVLHC